MAQTIKHRRGKLESIKDITPINGELIIASGSDLSVHQEGLLFVGVEGNVLTPSNKILTGSATAPNVTTSDFDHSVDGIPYYETDAKKLTILGHGGNTDVELAHGQIDFKGSGIVSSSSQVSELAGINNSTITLTAGDGLKTGGSFTTNASSNAEITIDIDVDAMAGVGLTPDNTNEELDVKVDDSSIEVNGSNALQVKDGGIDNDMLAGSIANGKLANSTISGVSLGSNLNSLSITANGGIGMTSYNGSAAVSNLALDIDGMTDIGAALVDADLMIVDDGAGGTNRKATMSRLATYMQSALTFSSGDIEGVTAGSGITQGGTSGTVVVGVDSGSLAGSGLVAPAGGAINVNVDDSTIEINSDTLRVKDNGITLAKLATQSNNTILGNISGGSAVPSALTAANVRTIINVEDGADATDATNVAAAGALMDSEVTNLAFVKSLAKGISDGNVLTANDVVADDDFLRINGTEVEGLSVSEVLTALSVESGADVTDATNVAAAGALMDSELTDLAGVKGVTISTLQSKPSEGAFANGDKTKLDGIAAGAQVNVSGDSGNAAIYDNSGTPAFKSGITKAEVLSILNVEDGADVTDTTNVTSAGALMDSEVTNLSFVKGLTKGISDGNVLTANDVVADDDFLRINGTEVEGLTAAETRTALNVEDGSTADQTAIEIINLLNSDLGGDKQIGNQSDDKMTFGGSVTVTGDLQVNGTTTSVNSTTVNIGDNILELNYAGTAADAGILVKDAVGGAGVSGSLLWDASEDYWVAGALGSEARVVVGTGTAGDIVKFSSAGVVTDSILSESGTTLTIANDVIVSGLTASQLVVTNGSKQLVSSTDISSLTLTLDGGQF